MEKKYHVKQKIKVFFPYPGPVKRHACGRAQTLQTGPHDNRTGPGALKKSLERLGSV